MNSLRRARFSSATTTAEASCPACPVCQGDAQTAATGAVLRVSTLRRYAREAGFSAVDVLPI
jgi:hypothetical protein